MEEMVLLAKQVYTNLLKDPEVDVKTKEKICSTILSGTQVFVKKVESEGSSTTTMALPQEIKDLMKEIGKNAEETAREIEANTIDVEPEGETE